MPNYFIPITDMENMKFNDRYTENARQFMLENANWWKNAVFVRIGPRAAGPGVAAVSVPASLYMVYYSAEPYPDAAVAPSRPFAIPDALMQEIEVVEFKDEDMPVKAKTPLVMKRGVLYVAIP